MVIGENVIQKLKEMGVRRVTVGGNIAKAAYTLVKTAAEELKNSGKPENIIKKISIGRLEKFIQENTLLNQYWVIDPKKKVKEIITFH